MRLGVDHGGWQKTRLFQARRIEIEPGCRPHYGCVKMQCEARTDACKKERRGGIVRQAGGGCCHLVNGVYSQTATRNPPVDGLAAEGQHRAHVSGAHVDGLAQLRNVRVGFRFR